MIRRTVSWLETLTKPKIDFRAGKMNIYVPREGYVFVFDVDETGKLEKPRKRDRWKHVIDLHHSRQEEPNQQPLSGPFEAAWKQAYAVCQSAKKRGIQIQEELF